MITMSNSTDKAALGTHLQPVICTPSSSTSSSSGVSNTPSTIAAASTPASGATPADQYSGVFGCVRRIGDAIRKCLASIGAWFKGSGSSNQGVPSDKDLTRECKVIFRKANSTPEEFKAGLEKLKKIKEYGPQIDAFHTAYTSKVGDAKAGAPIVSDERLVEAFKVLHKDVQELLKEEVYRVHGSSMVNGADYKTAFGDHMFSKANIRHVETTQAVVNCHTAVIAQRNHDALS